MKKALIIGAGGVGRVVAHKVAQLSDVFGEILLASRTKSRCDDIAAEIREISGKTIRTAALDADDPKNTVALIREFGPDIVINVALPYQDLVIMDACLETGVPYLDTANYEPPDLAKFEYKWQWAYQERFQKAGLMAVLGSGFDPGVTNVWAAYAQKKLFDEIHTIDILDCNAGNHGHKFATNFNPEINIREITQRGRYWERADQNGEGQAEENWVGGRWKSIEPMSVRWDFDFPEVGVKAAYLLYHEELESLAKNIKGLKQIRFWMTFGESYLKHLEVLQNVGMTRIDPIEFQGQQIVPIQFLKALLPDPASLAKNYTGKTCIGNLVTGIKDGKPRKVFIYNVCDHAETYKEVRSQAISYTTGVPAAVGAAMMVTGTWKGAGVFNIEELDPEPFLALLAEKGLPWQVIEMEP
ncbi:MAG TPA: saccharopine dehydrogenase family protein [Polyangiaceae bacterium]|nr:saccharopine dehydrogenase family protein [Polyangiaceae bacterium]